MLPLGFEFLQASTNYDGKRFWFSQKVLGVDELSS